MEKSKMKKSMIHLLIAAATLVSAPVFAESHNQCVANIQSHVEKEESDTLALLNLDECDITDEDVPAIVSFINSRTDISSVNLNNNNIHANGAKALAQVASVKELDLGINYLGDEGAAEIANNKSIDILFLQANDVGDNGAAALAKNKQLVVLLLNDNYVGDKGAAAFADSTIKELILEDNKIGDEGAIALAKNKYVMSLALNQNMIGDAGALAFVTNSTLHYLDLSENQIGEAAVKQLMSASFDVDLHGNPGYKDPNAHAKKSVKSELYKKYFKKKLTNR